MLSEKVKLFLKNLKSAESLRAKVARGGLWLGGGNGFPPGAADPANP